MKKILLLLALTSQFALADNCRVQQASQLVDRKVASEVTDLTKYKSEGSCRVVFKLQVDGKWHLVDHTYNGLYQSEILCQMAIEEGRGSLLSELGGTFETESVTVCKEGQNLKFRPVKIGDEILETEVRTVPESNRYFKYNNSKCRMFRERYNNGQLRVNHGVICQTDNNLWTVMDKW